MSWKQRNARSGAVFGSYQKKCIESMRRNCSILLILALLGIAGCALIPTQTPFVTPTLAPGSYDSRTVRATVAPQLTALAAAASVEEGALRQWASDAEAAAEARQPEHAAENAIGAPDFSPQCSGSTGPSGYGWVSPGGAVLNDSLTLFYEEPVTPTAIYVYETTDAVGALIRVDVVDTAGNMIVVYEGDSVEENVCGRIFSLGIASVTQKVDRVVLHFDRTLTSVWQVRYVEVDAVELVGNP